MTPVELAIGQVVQLADIVEVCTCNRVAANKLLAHGYRLLDISNESYWQATPGEANRQGFVRRVTYFVLGRPHGVERLDVWEGKGKK